MIADINTGTCDPVEVLSGCGKWTGGCCVLLCSFPAKNSVLAGDEQRCRYGGGVVIGGKYMEHLLELAWYINCL